MKDPIDSRQLHIFLALAKRGSLRDAAAELFITSSAVSHSIHSLETDLGTKLFHRPGKFLELTEKGQILLQEGSMILNMMERIRQQLMGDEALRRIPLRIAVGVSFLSHLLPDLIREWQVQFPQATILPRAAEREECLRLLAEGEVEASILVNPPYDQRLTQVPLFEDELMVLVGTGNALARIESLTLRHLHGKTLLVSRQQSYTTQMVLSEMRKQGFSFHDCIELGSTDAVQEMVRLGNGVALQAQWAMRERAPQSIVVKPLSQQRFTRQWVFARRKESTDTPQVLAFRKLCEGLAGSLKGYISAVSAFAMGFCCLFDPLTSVA